MGLSGKELEEFEKNEKLARDKAAVTVPPGLSKFDGECPSCSDVGRKHVLVQEHTDVKEDGKLVGKSMSGAISCMACGKYWFRSEIETLKKKAKKADKVA